MTRTRLDEEEAEDAVVCYRRGAGGDKPCPPGLRYGLGMMARRGLGRDVEKGGGAALVRVGKEEEAGGAVDAAK